VSARRWGEFLLPDAANMHLDWLRQLMTVEGGLIGRFLESPTARRMLTRRAHRRHCIAVPERVSLTANQQWLLSTPSAQIALARRLGLAAVSGFIRTTVIAASVAKLRALLGEEIYRRAVEGNGLDVRGLDRAQFDVALERGELDDYLVAVGAALLETTTQPGDPFCRVRMRFAFPPTCWGARPRSLVVDDAELAERIAEAMRE
jgi:hypothetical protein